MSAYDLSYRTWHTHTHVPETCEGTARRAFAAGWAEREVALHRELASQDRIIVSRDRYVATLDREAREILLTLGWRPPEWENVTIAMSPDAEALALTQGWFPVAPVGEEGDGS